MKKTLVSLAAASLIVTSAMAADKGIDIVTTGQAVVYYETASNDSTGDADLFDKTNSSANVAVQLNLAADLKNNFTFGSQLSYLGTAGLEKNVVDAEKQSTGGGLTAGTTDELAMTQIFVAKKVANTTVKLGRQELPKSLSPFAFSEGWNVLKNTFDAILAVNTDIPDTTLVGAYVSGGTGMSLGTTGNLTAAYDATSTTVNGTAYMLTVQNKSIPMTTITASYYDVAQVAGSIGATALWGDVKVAGKDLPMGLKLGLQGGKISTDNSGFDDTMAIGAKVFLSPINALTVGLAYTSVDGSDSKSNVAVKNFGTGIKTPLYTQMVYNQNAIALDANTFMVKAAYNTGDYGTIIAQYAGTAAGKSNIMGSEKDYNEFDVIYKVKAGGVQYFAGYINRTIDAGGSMNAAAGAEKDDRIRIWGRYNF
ncbi:hypothetical protein [Sulfurimonas sp.]|uniref:hypothetical protein n=1 Tax=Sulfurimonas sp. TaxID=2022749 RepID=UPI0035653E64